MADPTPPPGRRYDDDEVSLILKRAAEMQEAGGGATGEHATGMSLAELESIAKEAGLDPALVRRAARDVSAPGGATPARGGLAGAPTSLRYDREVEGELTEEDFEALVDDIRSALGDNGVASVLGHTLAWSSTPFYRQRRNSARQVEISIASRHGRTTIRVEEALGGLAASLFGGLVGGVGGGTTGLTIGIGMVVLHSVAAAAGIWGFTLLGSYGLARTLYVRAVGKRAVTLEQLADRLAERAAEAARSPEPRRLGDPG